MFLPHILAENALISEANIPASNGGGRLFYGSTLPLFSHSPGNAPKEQGEGTTYTRFITVTIADEQTKTSNLPKGCND